MCKCCENSITLIDYGDLIITQDNAIIDINTGFGTTSYEINFCFNCGRKFKVSKDIKSINSKIEIPKECGELILSVFKKYKAEEKLTYSTEESIKTVERYLRKVVEK